MTVERILEEDVDINHRAFGRRKLRSPHVQVDTTPDGRIGLQIAMTHVPDLILHDISTPTMPGREYLRRPRRLGSRGRSGASQDSRSVPRQRVSVLNAGAVDCVTKPFGADEGRQGSVASYGDRADRQGMTAGNVPRQGRC